MKIKYHQENEREREEEEAKQKICQFDKTNPGADDFKRQVSQEKEASSKKVGRAINRWAY